MHKIYFPNLNGLRFFAAFLVIIHHIEQIKSIQGIPNYWQTPFVSVIGKLGVVLFFVLSGFLITYLLLEEKNKSHTISIRKFYIRRVLRIWPLYYLIVLLGLFVYTQFDFFSIDIPSAEGRILKYLLYLTILPNLALAMSIKVPFIVQAWSIGVEEQFYLIWPQIIKRTHVSIKLFLVVLISYLIIKAGIYFFYILNPNIFSQILINFWDSFVISAMAIGGIYAYWLFEKKLYILNFFYNKVVQLIVYFITVLMMFFGIKFPYLYYEIYAVFFGFIIINMAGNTQNVLFSLENKMLNYLGKISYGLYMFHPIAIFVSIKCLNYYNLAFNNILLYILSLFTTILISMISYELYERKFINVKKRFSIILSGDNVKFKPE